MLTVDSLKNFGANTAEGLVRCMNNEGFYLMLVKKVLSDNKVTQLEQQISKKDLDSAFETAHAMKGMFSNLSLDPIANPVAEITELLRQRKDVDYSNLVNEIKRRIVK